MKILRTVFDPAPKFGYQNSWSLTLFDHARFEVSWWPRFFHGPLDFGLSAQIMWCGGIFDGPIVEVRLEPLFSIRLFWAKEEYESET